MFDFLRKISGKTIYVNDLNDLIGKVDLIDIRELYEYRRKSIKSSKNIPMDTLLNAPNKYLNKEKTYYIMCQSGGRSTMACRMLKQQGYDVINVSGGVGSYVGSKRN